MRIGLCETVNGVPWTYPDVNTLSIIWLRYMIPNGQAHQTLWSCGKKASSTSAYYYSCPINLSCSNAGTGAISSHCASTICVLNSY